MSANSYNLQGKQFSQGSNSYKIPTPNNPNNQMTIPINHPYNGNNNIVPNNFYNNQNYNQMPYQNIPYHLNENKINNNNYGNYPIQNLNYPISNNQSTNNSKIPTQYNQQTNFPMNLQQNINFENNYGKFPTPQNAYQIPTPLVQNNNFNKMNNILPHNPTPTPQGSNKNFGENNFQGQMQVQNDFNNNIQFQENNYRLPTPQNEYINKKNSRMPTPKNQELNENYNYPIKYTPIPTPQSQKNNQNFNLKNNILTKRDYVWEVKRNRAQTPLNAPDYLQGSQNIINNNINEQKFGKPLQQINPNDNSGNYNNSKEIKESYRIKKKQEPVIKPYSYHKSENAVNPKMKKNEITNGYSNNNNDQDNYKRTTPSDYGVGPKIHENFWEEREKRNFMKQGYNDMVNLNTNHNNIDSCKPSSSQSNKPFQNITFKNTGTPNNNNFNMNLNLAQQNPYINQQMINQNYNINQQIMQNGYPINMGYNQSTPQAQLNSQNNAYPNNSAIGTPIQIPLNQRENMKFVYNRQQQ